MDWDYKKHQVHLSMPNYVKKALKQFHHIVGKLQHSPYPSIPIQYSTKKQHTMQESNTPLLDDKAKQFIQQVQADRAYGTEISLRLFVISFVILLYAISYNICI